jgi:hypothetical protein
MKSIIFGCAIFLCLIFAASVCAQTMYVPQVVNGDFGNARYRTTFILLNNSDTAATPLLTLTDDLGNPVTVTIDGFGTASQFSIDMLPGGTGLLETDGRGSPSVGAATLASSAPVGFSAFYTADVIELTGYYAIVLPPGIYNFSPYLYSFSNRGSGSLQYRLIACRDGAGDCRLFNSRHLDALGHNPRTLHDPFRHYGACYGSIGSATCTTVLL